jgi:cytoskeletal protein CcmA (bactofilin family)
MDPPRFDADDAATTVIAASARFDGSMRSAGGAVISGRIEGDLAADGAVLVEATGSIGGSVTAAAAKVEGTIEGSLEVTGRAEVDSGGRVGGPVRAARVDVAAGALLDAPVEAEDGPHRFAERRGKRR